MLFSQSLLYWYAYRIDIMANDPATRVIAVGCDGTGPGNTCYFDEFLRYIQKTGKKTKAWTGSTTVGEDLTPNVLATAEELATGGVAKTPSRYSNTADVTKLCKALKNKGPVNYDTLMTTVVDSIQSSRAKVASSTEVNIDTELNGAREALTITHKARVADNAAAIIKGANQILKGRGIKWVRKTDGPTNALITC
ncbi:hypothetical protein BO94DRAFT_338998 [Aspergillus sclerotioniger CBS 115572]|uniref:Uncharacterized protein n=1 Tax=Aspergillus sclerotioniger CBS 115572 TaxID=1450535 RepID=A0A317UW67_9EURO|nr:hypothetical protein BO94DRAFT_338998 [Aspergillus sclerotioniger CBS 115572]PWY65641.1 hypothetical protein BO94DRAFT_338998 [Aspergillus sclerotioniger CBS 115572]